MADDHKTVASQLAAIVDTDVTQATISGNTLLIWLGAPPKTANAKCLWVNPPWRLENENSFLLGSADIPWDEDEYESKEHFRTEFDRACDRAREYLTSRIVRATTLFLSTDLSISFASGATLRSFECEHGTDESWHLSDYSTMKLMRVAPCGVMVEPLAP